MPGLYRALTALRVVETPLPDFVGTRLVLALHRTRSELGFESVELATRGWDRRIRSPVDDRDDIRRFKS
jgi:hypothetical protein